tara:strand:- start:1076 stop:1381 length:306 start_codon:yes stop_codon:yes gene_type:complete
LTKGKVVQIGLIISLLGLILYNFAPNEISAGSVSNIVLFLIIFIWVASYIIRVVNGKMTFIEQRKRYRKKYDKIMDEKLQKKFNAMSVEEQNIILKDLDEN